MPIYEFEAASATSSCAKCRSGFELLMRMSDPPVTLCPECGAPVRKKISAPAVGGSASGFDERAKNAGFHKLKRLGKGEYERQY
ncbi:MAG: zinc ribbon domain-containing protein [Lentisphaerae bacterium]|nr:zinc ribbon domain-containing protein [Lentisphaerota bacterium]